MSSKDKGKDFLFSSDCGFIKGEDGESYKYSDGSGYYHGKDGSEGYIYSDGSGYYHGADGSEGYIYSDGSAYYHGADGSDGHKYSDGSGILTELMEAEEINTRTVVDLTKTEVATHRIMTQTMMTVMTIAMIRAQAGEIFLAA